MLKEEDHNVFVWKSNVNKHPLMLWSPFGNENCQAVLNSPEELNKLHPDFSINTKYFENYESSIFVDAENNNFRLTKEFSEITKGAPIPEKIRKAMGLSENEYRFFGAFPVN